MPSFAVQLTKWTLDLATKLVKADVRLHNVELLRDDMSAIFVVNHFTRLETLLLPYILHKHTGRECWSLAAGELFAGRVGGFLRANGTVSTQDPDRDKVIIRALLRGEHPWIIFPEGAMIKDKKVVDHRGEFAVFNNGTRRPPHTGAGALALRTEFYRHKLESFSRTANREELERVLRNFDLESLEGVSNKYTVVIPANVTYFPMRAYENVFLRFARAVAGELPKRAVEELSVEGTILSADTRIDITLGTPIDVRNFLRMPEHADVMACGVDEIDALETDAKSLFNEAARRLMLTYMKSLYRLTTINGDHVLAGLLRHQWRDRFTEWAWRNRAFLCAHEIERLHDGIVHEDFLAGAVALIEGEPNARFEDFAALCEREGVLERKDGACRKIRTAAHAEPDVHSIRRERLTRVIANEIEPIRAVDGILRRVARTPGWLVARKVRKILVDEDRRRFEEDYRAEHQEGFSKGPEVGRPFLLKPWFPRGSVVLIHGYMAAPLEIRALAEHLHAKGYAVYGVRLKGHGTSPTDLGRTAWEQWYESVDRGFAVAQTISPRVILGGFSLGAGLALLAAARKGANVEAVAAIGAPLQLRNPAARFAPSVVKVNAWLKWLRWGGRRWEYLDNFPENKHINYSSNPVAGVAEMNEAMQVMAEALPQVCSPTLVIQGSNDPTVHPDSALMIFDELGTRLKELTIFDRENHGIVNGPGSKDVFVRVEQFLQWAHDRQRGKNEEGRMKN